MPGIDPVVALVVAVAENGVIGRAGRLPWRIPSEMQHFRRITLDKPVDHGPENVCLAEKAAGASATISS